MTSYLEQAAEEESIPKKEKKNSMLEKYERNPDELKPPSAPQNKSTSMLDKYGKAPPMERDEIYQLMKAEDKTAYEIKNMSLEERMQYAEDLRNEREYLYNAGFTKSLLSHLTLGTTERVESLKPQEYESGLFVGGLTGEALLLAPIFKGLSSLISLNKTKGIPGGVARLGMHGAGAATIGAGKETARELIAGEEIQPEKIKHEALMFGGIDLGIGLLAKSPAGLSWLNSLRPSERAKVAAQGLLPENIPNNALKRFQEEVLPELKKTAEKEYELAVQEREADLKKVYQQELNVAKAEHEAESTKLRERYETDLKNYYEESQAERDRVKSANEAIDQKFKTDTENYHEERRQIELDAKSKNEAAQEEYKQQVKEYLTSVEEEGKLTAEENAKIREKFEKAKRDFFEAQRREQARVDSLNEALDKEYAQKVQDYNLAKQVEENRVKSLNEALDYKFSEKQAEQALENQRLENQYKQKYAEIKGKHEKQLIDIEEHNKKLWDEYQKGNQEYEQEKNILEMIKQKKREASPQALQGRVKAEADRLGVPVPAPYQPKSPLHEKIGNIFSDTPMPNSTFGGAKLKEGINRRSADIKADVNSKYKLSDEANADITGKHPDLVNEITKALNYYKKIPHPSTPTKQLIATLEDIQKNLADVTKDGMVTAYKTIENKVMLDQAKELRFMVDYDFAHGKPTNIFRPWIKRIQQSAEEAAYIAGKPEAAHLNEEARQAHEAWTTIFDNPDINPFRNKSNHHYTKLYKFAQERDVFMKIDNILSETSEGSIVSNSLKRSMVENKLEPVLTGKAKPEELNKIVEELYPLVTKEEAQQIKHVINESKVTPVIKAKKIAGKKKPEHPKGLKEIPEEPVPIPLKPKEGKVERPSYEEYKYPEEPEIPEYEVPSLEMEFPELPQYKTAREIETPKPPEEIIPEIGREPPTKPEYLVPKEKAPPIEKQIESVKIPKYPKEREKPITPAMATASKEMEVTASEVMRMTKSLEGLQKLKDKVTPKVFDKIVEETTRDILYGGDVKRVLTGNDLAKAINKGENYSRLAFMHGEQKISKLLDLAHEIANKEITWNTAKKLGLSAAKLKILKLMGLVVTQKEKYEESPVFEKL